MVQLIAQADRPSRAHPAPAGRHARQGRRSRSRAVDADKPWRIDEKSFLSKSKNSPFDGRPVQGRVIGTWLDGRRDIRGGGVIFRRRPRRLSPRLDPFGLVLTRLAGLGDLRRDRLRQYRRTNVLRTGNKKLAALTLAARRAKGAVAVLPPPPRAPTWRSWRRPPR